MLEIKKANKISLRFNILVLCIHLYSENFRAQKGEPIQIKTPNPFSYEMEDTWTPFVSRQTTMMSPVMRVGSKSPTYPLSPRRQKPSESPDLTLYPVQQGLLMSPSPRYGTGLGGKSGFINYI